MATEPGTDSPRAGDGAARLLARAAAAGARAHAHLGAAIRDVSLSADVRIDDRRRAAVGASFAALVATVEGELREHGARLLRGRGQAAQAAALTDAPASVADRLWRGGLADDADFMGELIARVHLDVLADLLPDAGRDDPDRPSLLPRLTEHADRVVAAGARAVLAADNRRRAEDLGGRTDLPAALHRRLLWWVAAALRTDAPDAAAGLDAALAEAVQRNLDAHDEAERLEVAALRLAAAIDPRPDELPPLLAEALGDRRPALFVALLAQALRLPFEAAREIVLDRGGERLWLACRALDLPRETIARIGLLLAEAEPRRDVERLAADLDDIAAIPADVARDALVPLTLPGEYRAALDGLRGGR